MTKRDEAGRGFTLILVPHHGALGRQIEVHGRGLILLMTIAIVLLLVVVGAAYVAISGFSRQGELVDLRETVSELRDSLGVVEDYRIRLEAMERELAEIRLARGRVENILCLVSGETPGDSSRAP